MDTDNASQRCPEKLPVAQDRNPPALGVFASDSHRLIHQGARFSANRRELLRQRGDIRRLVAGLNEQRGNEAVARRSRREHHVPGLDVGVPGRAHGQPQRLLHELVRYRLIRQEHPRRTALVDQLLEVGHG
jgi:hypothetical protein